MTPIPIFEVHPLKDERWVSFVDSHPKSSVFHTTQWIEALVRTYDYIPAVFTTNPAGQLLTNGILCCRVNSWLTGSRIVSLPFSDHCEPLVGHSDDLQNLLTGMALKASGKIKYVEIRPRSAELSEAPEWKISARHAFHTLDLRPAVDDLYSRLHKDSIRRKIRRAEREQVSIEQGRSDILLKEFYQLMLLTRRRHRIPPQPLEWFQNLVALFGPQLTIHVARVNHRPIASILTLRHKQTMTYKYGCSDERFHQLGGMPLLFWQAIREARAEELDELDLGRSDNPGLIQFKEHLGASVMPMSYWRFSRIQTSNGIHRPPPLMEKVLVQLPDRLFRLVGELFYRHAG